MLSTCIFNCNDTDSWKKNRYHLLSKSGFPNLLWRFIATSVVVARNRVVMDAPLFSSEKTRNETQLKSQRHSTAFPWPQSTTPLKPCASASLREEAQKAHPWNASNERN